MSDEIDTVGHCSLARVSPCRKARTMSINPHVLYSSSHPSMPWEHAKRPGLLLLTDNAAFTTGVHEHTVPTGSGSAAHAACYVIPIKLHEGSSEAEAINQLVPTAPSTIGGPAPVGTNGVKRGTPSATGCNESVEDSTLPLPRSPPASM